MKGERGKGKGERGKGKGEKLNKIVFFNDDGDCQLPNINL